MTPATLAKKASTALRILRTDPASFHTLRTRWHYFVLRCRLDRAPEGWFTYRSYAGTPFIVDGRNPATFFIYTCGHPDEAELSVVSRWLDAGDLCLDLGANIGFFAAVMAACVGTGGLVCAIEPAPATFAFLKRTLHRLGLTQVHPRQACAGSAPATAIFYAARHPDLSPNQTLFPDRGHQAAWEPVSVPVLRADACARDLAPGRSTALVKIDVEGAEPEALEGCRALLEADDPPLFDVEINPPMLARREARPSDILLFFELDRFELLFASASPAADHPWPRHCLIPLPDLRDEAFPSLGNLIAVPRAGRFAARRSRLSVS